MQDKVSLSERVKKLFEAINLSGLNDEEKESLRNPITLYSHLFYLEGGFPNGHSWCH